VFDSGLDYYVTGYGTGGTFREAWVVPLSSI
jgi:hypothetical protein